MERPGQANQPGAWAAQLGGIGAFTLANIENTNKSMYIFNDNAPAALSDGGYNANYYVNHNVSFDQYGNFRLYLGHTPAPANGNLSALGTASGTTTTWDVATAAGEVANLDIVQNSNAYDPNGGYRSDSMATAPLVLVTRLASSPLQMLMATM